MKKKLIDAEAWLKQCNLNERQSRSSCENCSAIPRDRSWMYYNTAKKVIREAPCYEVEEGLLTPCEGRERATNGRPYEERGKVSDEATGCWCRACGAEIVFITMRSGAKMPCDAELIHAVADEKAKTSFVLPGGIIKRGREGRHPDGMADFVGYRSHFETCPKAGEFRRQRK